MIESERRVLQIHELLRLHESNWAAMLVNDRLHQRKLLHAKKSKQISPSMIMAQTQGAGQSALVCLGPNAPSHSRLLQQSTAHQTFRALRSGDHPQPRPFSVPFLASAQSQHLQKTYDPAPSNEMNGLDAAVMPRFETGTNSMP